MGPKQIRSTVLTPEEEAIVVVCCGAGPHHVRALAEALGRRPLASRYSSDMARHSYFGTAPAITAKNREYARRL
jgi:betaine-homocysteine S-methyltransferase